MPKPIVARTREEVDRALSSGTEQVTVEGDDELLNYALSEIATLNRPPMAGAATTRRRPYSLLIGSILAVAIGAVVLFGSSFLSAPTSLPNEPYTNVSYSSRLTSTADVMPLVWAAIVLVAIVLMYLLARQAIAGGSNVTLQWKVTEKMQGKLTVTRASATTRRKK